MEGAFGAIVQFLDNGSVHFAVFWIRMNRKLVEAVGVEPTSENVTGQEPTYLVQFTRRELPRQIRVVRLERTRNAKR